MRKPFLFLLSAVVLTVLWTATSVNASTNPPFQPGEKLTFNLRWGVFSAGTAILEVHPMAELNGEEVYHFSLTVRTNSFVDRIYKVRDRIDAYATSDMGASALYRKKQREGRHERDILVTFDLDEGKALYSNFGKEDDPIDIKPNTFDPLSVFYAFRMQPVEENSTVQLYVTDGKELQLGEGRIGRREKIRVPAGEFEAILVEPDMRDVGGVFEESDDATLQIWLSDDDRRIPVRLSSKVVVGSFHADLIEIDGEERASLPDPPSVRRRR